MKPHSTFALAPRGLLLAAIAILSGCGSSTPPQAPPPGPQDVTVVTINPQRVTLTTDLPGRTSSYRVADVRPQVNGIIQKRLFKEGAEVNENDQLYQIDPAPYQAAYDSALAQLAHAQAGQISAKSLVDRDQPLVDSHAVAKQDYDNAVAAEKQAEADVASGQAAVETAHVNLVYTKVLSPIKGRTGRSVTEGTLVTANQTNVLVTIQQLDPIYVDIPQTTAVLLRLRRERDANQITGPNADEAQVKLILEDGSNYDQEGHLEFSEVTVDPTTGSVILRAVFPNPNHLLLPGMFVRAVLEEGTNDNALLVPQQAVTHDPQGHATAFVVTSENKVELRVLTTSRTYKDQWIVTDGINAGDRVIIEGLQKVKPGATVRATEQAPPPAAPAQS